MGGDAELLPGTLDLLILKSVSLGALHGYGILLRIQQISGEALTIEWGVSDNNRRAKFYSLTAAGRKRLRSETEGWKRLVAAMTTALKTRIGEL